MGDVQSNICTKPIYLITKFYTYIFQYSFISLLKELNYRLNFKIYSESIVYKFEYYSDDKITNEQLNLINKIYTQMIANEWIILILNLKSLNSCLLYQLIDTNEEISVDLFNSEQISNGKKKIIYYKQWQFIIDCYS